AGNGPQTIKALLYRGKYAILLEEDGVVIAVKTFEEEEQVAPFPESAVLQSLLGELYSTYLQNQGWRIRNRTPVPDGEGGDILTWSADQLEQKAQGYYQQSIENVSGLQAVPVGYLDPLLIPGLNDSTGREPLRPTLFDLLAHRALDHFANERSYLTEPAYKFYLDQEEVFDPAYDFVNARFESRDSSSGKWLAIRLFQQVLRVHLSGSNTAALVDADLKRLQFARNNSILESRYDLYQQALAIVHKTHYNYPSDAEIVYEIAQALVEEESRLPKPPADLLRRAVSECENAIERHPNTFGAKQCAALLYDLRRPALDLDVESVNIPGKPVLLSVSIKNLSALHVKVVSVPNDPDVFNRMDWEDRLAYLNNRPALQRKRWPVADPGDYRHHRTELSLEALPAGRYFVLAATSESFTEKDQIVSFAPFTCSNLAAVNFQIDSKQRFAVVHRQSGVPLAGVLADCYESYWDNNARQQRRNRVRQVRSDREGLLDPDLDTRRGYTIRLSQGEDTLWLERTFRDSRPYTPVYQPEVQFFTDRSLYRPGQTVYFKGVVLQRKENGYPEILPDKPVTVRFLDANYQEKGTLELRTNAFGTFNGAFQAPASGLTGRMHIEVTKMNGAAWFNVEEYKRPRFEVTIKQPEEAYRVNDTVTVRGEAKNYAGSNVDGAAVRYRVVRRARFPWWPWGFRPYFNLTEMEITNGETTTGPDGSFSIEFVALPDRAIPQKSQPVFDYSVYVDVTDITGETRSGQAGVQAGYVALQVDLALPDEVELDSLRHVAIHTTNNAGQFQAAAGVVDIQRLEEPAIPYVRRYWDDPDIQTLDSATFRQQFPDYAWNGADKPDNWEREDMVRPVNFNTASNTKIDLHGGQMTTGYYLVRLTTSDRYGTPIEIKKIIRVWDAGVPGSRFVYPGCVPEKPRYEPGSTARIWMGGQADRLLFLLVEEREGKQLKPRWYDVAGAQAAEIAVGEKDRGGMSLSAFTVQRNRLYSMNQVAVQVPWSNKQLHISYETFRDKLLPGAQEEWRLKISGPQKEQVAAEMVAAMYDASLDQFLPHNWQGIRFPSHRPLTRFNSEEFRNQNSDTRFEPVSGMPQPGIREYPSLDWFRFPLYGGRMFQAMYRMAVSDEAQPLNLEMAVEPMLEAKQKAEAVPMAGNMNGDEAEASGGMENDTMAVPEEMSGEGPGDAPPLSPRRNLNETVFFFPELRTDAEGNVIVKFTMNEALTQWKFLAFAHTKELQWALSENTVVTQKELMILTNPPRFLREGDVLEFSAKVSNLSENAISGTAYLNLFDAVSMEPVDPAFGLDKTSRTLAFTVLPGQSTPVTWRLRVPEGAVNGLTWQVFADGRQFRDGEENTLPVLTNRMLVTEALPITVRGASSKSVVFEHLKENKSGTLRHHRYTLEFSSNPAWYAVQALPYIMEFPHECNEQLFSRFYANTLATSVTQKLPSLRRVYDRWKGTDAMKSNLTKNQELKTALLEETPWVLDAQSEEQQKQQIALLFDLNRMADEQERVLAKLRERQGGGGGWSWFPGGRENWYITQHIAAGFGHLDKLGAFNLEQDPSTSNMLDRALAFCDGEIQHQYRELERAVQNGRAKWEDDHLDGLVIQYLYTRSFFPLDRVDKVTAYYLGQGEKYWLKRGLYEQGMLALALHRHGRTEAAQRIVASLRERALVKEELGMYWPFEWGMYWYQLPIETQALMVEVFDEVASDAKAVEELRIWLLKNKQTNRWESTKATALAVYALLLHGDNWLLNSKPVQVKLGGEVIQPQEYEPGTGYFKETWTGADVRDSWSIITVDNPNSNIVWGAAYWQYFEDLDKISTFKETPLDIDKQVFLEENSPTGPQLSPVTERTDLKPGDKLKVRIEIRVDRPMEFVHLKDMRASGLEPVNVLSGYRWQDGLGYYESTRDLATHFFIEYLPRGTYVFEYPLVVSHRGDFSNGITTIQCMYAPEFTSHSQGIRLRVGRN
ncbi:MAG: hypothetical protein EP344_07205, partial [Bacteroidetes bacterium]